MPIQITITNTETDPLALVEIIHCSRGEGRHGPQIAIPAGETATITLSSGMELKVREVGEVVVHAAVGASKKAELKVLIDQMDRRVDHTGRFVSDAELQRRARQSGPAWIERMERLQQNTAMSHEDMDREAAKTVLEASTFNGEPIETAVRTGSSWRPLP